MSAGSLPLSPSEASLAPGYVALFWRTDTPPSAAEELRAAIAANAPSLKLQLSRPGLIAFADESRPQWSVAIDRAAKCVLVGAAFSRDSLSGEGAESADVDEVAGLDDVALLRRIWGGFVALRWCPASPHLRILRDPSGALPALAAEGDGFGLVTSSLPRWLRQATGLAPVVDVRLLALALADPLLPTHRSLLRGVHQLAAGCVLGWDGRTFGQARPLWPNPDLLEEPAPDDPGAPERLRMAVAGCVRALASRHRHVTLELSGGLDSAIVLGAMASAPDPVDISCVNFAVAHSGGDERSEARAVADRWQVRLVEVSAEAKDLRFEELLEGEQPVEPVLFGLDPILERATIGVAKAFDASAIFTGQGGDALFFHLPTPLVAVDYARAVGARAHFSPVAYEAAQRSHRSIWRIEWLMLRDRLGLGVPVEDVMPGMQLGAAASDPGNGNGGRHPWLRGDGAMAPARRMQLGAISNCQHFSGPTWRGGVAALVHPLLAQPVVETCLQIPTYRLASGSGNRALARQVFADWLPGIVRSRHDKGDATNYYRRAVAENLPYLREFMLDGVLVSMGLLDRTGIDTALRDENLIWSDGSRLIAVYASFEAWARYWGLPGSAC